MIKFKIRNFFNRMTRLLIHLSMLFLLSGCAGDLAEYFGRHGMLTPEPAGLADMPQGDDDYSQGFRDGCNTAISITGSGFLSTYDPIFYDFDKSLSSPEYYRGRTVGKNYCMYYVDNNPL